MLRAHPYRLLFPVGLLCAWAGVAHWVLHALGVIPQYHSIFHAIVQIQAFMTSFVVGFLLTAIPRRTQSAPPSLVLVILGGVAPVVTVVAAWFEQWIVSQMAWLVLTIGVIVFTCIRLFSPRSGRRGPVAFVWILSAFVIGIVGSVLAGARAFLGEEGVWLHDLGRGLLLQGMLSALVVGVGSMVVPLLTRKEPVADATPSPADRGRLAAHILGGIALAATFWVEHAVDARAGWLLRGLVLLGALVLSTGVWRPTSVGGWHRWLVWGAIWLVPAGYLLAAMAPKLGTAALHLTFIGGFALLAFAVSMHVTLAHEGHPEALSARAPSVLGLGAFMAAAVVFRILVDADPDRFLLWLGLAASSFLVATLLWGWRLLPVLRRA